MIPLFQSHLQVQLMFPNVLFLFDSDYSKHFDQSHKSFPFYQLGTLSTFIYEHAFFLS